MVEVKARKVTAAELAKLQEKSAINPVTIPEATQKEMDRLKAFADNLDTINQAQKEAAFHLAPEEEEFPLDSGNSVDDDYWKDPIYGMLASRPIEYFDGRKVHKVVLGPPTTPTEIIIGDIFNNRENNDLKLNTELTVATVLQFVREIDGRKLPGAAVTWNAVDQIYRQLGQIGYRAVKEAYELTWPSGIYWRDVKKNLLE